MLLITLYGRFTDLRLGVLNSTGIRNGSFFVFAYNFIISRLRLISFSIKVTVNITLFYNIRIIYSSKRHTYFLLRFVESLSLSLFLFLATFGDFGSLGGFGSFLGFGSLGSFGSFGLRGFRGDRDFLPLFQSSSISPEDGLMSSESAALSTILLLSPGVTLLSDKGCSGCWMAVVGADASLSAFLRLFFARGVPLLRPRPVVLDTYFQ